MAFYILIYIEETKLESGNLSSDSSFYMGIVNI